MDRILSIIVPVYNEEESINELYKRIVENMHNLMDNHKISNYEIWFVSDGCTDNSEKNIKLLIDKNKNVHLIAFRKNFGKATALQSGFRHANGDIVITMDADLQDDPNEIGRFIEKLDEGYDMVSGWKYNRLDPLEKTLPSKLFNRVTSKLSGVDLHDFNCGFKAYTKTVIKSLDIYGEMHRYIPVLVSRKGFKIAEIVVKHHKREYGKSKYGWERYLRGLLDSMTTSFLLKFSDRPMYFFGRMGLMLLTVGILICGYLTVLWFGGNMIGNRPLLLLGVLCILTGGQFISTGFLGEMLVDVTYRQKYEEQHIREII